ncbi:SPOR domain-containing protein [Flavobacterium sp.]|uniref:HU domain-containing protein n=1 Tax=Flavobacterium sp. TaxID=239 RepID=UPI00374FFF5F
MKMDQYISQLLYRYQCVTVPGFGAFLTEIQSAQLHENSNSFYPPKKLVSFNSYLKNNDGLLANHISQSEKISYEVAVTIIENQVATWKSKLHDFGAIALKNVGEISLNAENNLVFVPYEQINYLTQSFGLTAYVSPVIKREVAKHVEEVSQEKETISLVLEKSNSKNYLKYVAVFVVSAGLLSAGGFFGDRYYQNKIQEETLAVQTKVQNKVNQKIQEATFFINNPLPNVTLAVDNKKNYHVVAGVYQKEFYANKLFTDLEQLGYSPKRLSPNKFGMFPVLYESYSSYTEAQNALLKVQKEHNPEAWLMIKEL